MCKGSHFSGSFVTCQSTHEVIIVLMYCFCNMLEQKQGAELDLSTEVATRLSLVDRETPAISLPDTHSAHTAHTRHSDEDIPRLTKVRLARS